MCVLLLGSYNITNVLPSAPDIAQFKQGVKSVAGKLSVLANGVMTSIQVSRKLQYINHQLKSFYRALVSIMDPAGVSSLGRKE